MESLRYESSEIEEYFSTHRLSWDEFYPSERALIESVWPSDPPHVLDIGSACGGLGLALTNRFGVLGSYTGIEFNAQASLTARRLSPSSTFIEGDFLKIDTDDLREGGYDLVFSLSCVDWQFNTLELLRRAWDQVAPGGLLILTLRMTLDRALTAIDESYQFINYSGALEGERAPYVVLNAREFGKVASQLGASGMRAKGYWGAPSSTAVTPLEQVCFVAIAMSSSMERLGREWVLDLPEEVAEALGGGRIHSL